MIIGEQSSYTSYNYVCVPFNVHNGDSFFFNFVGWGKTFVHLLCRPKVCPQYQPLILNWHGTFVIVRISLGN
jgi:hypothetical protein